MKIRHRIMLWVAGAGLLTSLTFSMIVYWELHDRHLDMIDSQMKAAAAVVGAQLPRLQSRAGHDIELPVYFDNYWIKVFDQGRHPVYQSDLAGAVELPLRLDADDDSYLVETSITGTAPDAGREDSSDITFLVRVVPETVPNGRFLIQIARPVENLKGEELELLAAIGIGLAASTLLLTGLSYMLARRIVKPVAAINRLARDINEHTLQTRIPLGGSRDEIYELAARLNEMFDRLQYSFARQKRYLADASHELKSPIAILKLFFEEMMQRPNLPDGFREQLIAQNRNIFRMDRLVKSLLELSVLEISPPPAMKPLDISDMARSVLTDFSPIIQKAEIRLETEIPERLIVSGDKDKLRRVLINIIDNCVKYNVAGGQIRVQMHGNRRKIHLAVLNTGPGIPEEDLPKVFDQFYRVDKSRSVQLGGAGLGLSIVREIIRLHQGMIDINSRPNGWTRIDIALPTYKEAMARHGEQAEN